MRFDYTEHFLDIDGLTVRYWDQGQGEPLLLIHGLGVCLETWAWNIDALAAQHRVIALDLPGAGKSSRSDRDNVFSIRFACRFLRRFTEQLGISTLSVAGNSMGGSLAIQFALLNPGRVRSLILVDAAGLGTEIHWVIRLLTAPLARPVIAHPPRPLVIQAARQAILRQDSEAEELFRRIAEYLHAPGTGADLLRMARRGVNARGQMATYSAAKLGKIQAPTLVIWGEKDRLIPVRHAEIALRGIPDCRAVVTPHAGHAPQIDRPEAVNELFLEFLAAGRLAREDPLDKQVIRL